MASSHDNVTLPPSDATSRVATPAAATRVSGGGFAPGAIVAGRYRLVALLGKGGMGEVYRADDLTLEQPVALKFLTAGGADGAGLVQLHAELRTARHVSHKNVCRLYDLGDADGRRFITMEYVDGEDLGSLLRRIGRFPQDRAIEIARQLCAGVAAAHERSVIHRDLKPANVMIDGDGHVRITDFGIATAASDTDTAPAGTPQYMAPEQLAGRPASIKSDIYALGLILFEIFTGKRAYEAKSIADLRQLHDTGMLATPSAIVRDLDPAVERVILRCLDRDPERRPASALAVAAGLPGGNPLADALAAGETPSPDLLVAAGEQEAIGVGRGLGAVAFVLVGLAAIVAITPSITLSGQSPLDKPPAVLVDRAEQIRTSLGYTDPVADSAFGLSTHAAYLRWLVTSDSSPQRWNALRAGNPSAVLLWHRTSPRLLIPTRVDPQVAPNDPPMGVTGMTYTVIDSTGRLIEFQAVPPQVSADDGPAPAPRWQALFDAAGLDMATFTQATPQWSPKDFADTRAAWEGPMTGRPDLRVRVEAAAYRGKPTSMLLLGPWSRPTRMTVVTPSLSQTVLSGAVTVVIIALTVAALGLARFNLRTQRADRRAASRLALFFLIGYAVTFLLIAHHLPDVQQELNLFLRAFGEATIDASILWVMYLALEPYVRRFWPDGILGWARLLSGRVRDPRVGRDLLIGCVLTVAMDFWQAAYIALPAKLGFPPPPPVAQVGVPALAGIAATLNMIFSETLKGLFVAVFLVLGYVLLRLLLRRSGLAIAAAVVLLALVQAPQVLSTTTPWWIALIFQIGIVTAAATIVIRYGLLVTAVALGIGNMLGDVPLTPALSHWTATTSNLAVGTVVALACFGFYAARAGQPLFGKLEMKT